MEKLTKAIVSDWFTR